MELLNTIETWYRSATADLKFTVDTIGVDRQTPDAIADGGQDETRGVAMHNQNEACIDPDDSAQHETAVVNRTDSIDDDSSHINNDEQLEEQADVMPECVENVQLYEKRIKLFHSVLQATMHDHAHRAPPPLTICKWKF
jgi:hypothetical protein